MRGFEGAIGLTAARSGTRVTRAWLVLTLVLGACAPDVHCRFDRDCPAAIPSCGCDGRCQVSVAAVPDAGPDGPPSITVAVVSYRSAPSDTSRAFGIDLDGQIGGPDRICMPQPDFVSALTGEEGVDNQFMALSHAVDWDDAVGTTVLAGAEVLVLEVRPVAADGCAFRVRAWTARFDRAPIALDANCRTCDPAREETCFFPATGGCVGIAGGQTWRAIDDLGEVDARLIAGRLRTSPFPRVPLLPTIAPNGMTPVLAPIDMHGVVLEADLGATTLRRVEIGGAIAVADLEAWANTHVVGPSFVLDDTTYRTLFKPDLAPNPLTGECDALSAGFQIGTVGATLVH